MHSFTNVAVRQLTETSPHLDVDRCIFGVVCSCRALNDGRTHCPGAHSFFDHSVKTSDSHRGVQIVRRLLCSSAVVQEPGSEFSGSRSSVAGRSDSQPDRCRLGRVRTVRGGWPPVLAYRCSTERRQPCDRRIHVRPTGRNRTLTTVDSTPTQDRFGWGSVSVLELNQRCRCRRRPNGILCGHGRMNLLPVDSQTRHRS